MKDAHKDAAVVENGAGKTRCLIVLGTRPEAIKLAPVIRECRQRSELETIVCSTGQHREMLVSTLDYFGIKPELELDLMRPGQSLAGITGRCLQKLDEVIADTTPNFIVGQGDTATVGASAMASFFRKIPFVHVEAGLRTWNLRSPWPEEFNRRIASLATSIHCAPTSAAAENLLAEDIDPSTIHVTGNTVVDALLWTADREKQHDASWEQEFPQIKDRRVVLITGHRRENFGDNFESICRAIRQLAESYRDCQFVYPVHLNPNVREPVYRLLGGRDNIHLIEPLGYPAFVWMMSRCDLILTDSGGVQEEAPSLKKPTLVMRDTTERPEAMKTGYVKLVGATVESIVAEASQVLDNPNEQTSNGSVSKNPFGDGKAAARIVDLMMASGAAPNASTSSTSAAFTR